MSEPSGEGGRAEELSHELRTPLTSITLYLALIERRVRARIDPITANGGLDELVTAALADATRMAQAIDRLLARSRGRPGPSSGIYPNPPEEVPMGDRRFDRHWVQWDARIAAGDRSGAIIGDLSMSTLAELLAADAGVRRSTERNIIATALTNRISHHQGEIGVPILVRTARTIAGATQTVVDMRRLLIDVRQVRDASRLRRVAAEAAPRSHNGFH